MKDYSSYYPSKRDRRKHKTTTSFLIHHRESNEGCTVYVNDDVGYRLPVIIKDHSNPINDLLEDKKMYFLNDYEEKMINWGDEITIKGSEKYEDGKYLVITRPDTDGYESKCRIRKMNNDARFKVGDKEYNYKCIMADGLLYNATSYTGITEVFKEEDYRAILLKYDVNTSKLKLFEDIHVDDVYYKIAKIDTYTLKRHEEDFGVIQMTLIRTIFGTLKVNGVPFVGLTLFERMKEAIYNSKARGLLNYHNVVKPGDYVSHTFLRDESGNYETRIYIVRSLVDMRNDYDKSFILNCDAEFNLKRIKDFEYGESIMIPAYFEDNRTQLIANERNTNAFIENSKYQCIVQHNAHTKRLGTEVSRIIIKNKAYRVLGIDEVCLDGAIYVGLMDSKINPSRDNLELGIADYYDDVIKTEESDYDKTKEIIGSDTIIFGDTGIYQVNDNIDWHCITWEIDGEGAKISAVAEDKCVIEIENKSKLVGKKIVLKAEMNTGEIYMKNIEVVGW